MRHQHRDLAIPDFPTAYGQWIPHTGAAAIAEINAARDTVAMSDVSAAQIWLQLAHRFGAVLVAIGVIWFSVSATSRENFAVARTFHRLAHRRFAKVTLGAWTIWSNKAADSCDRACGRGRNAPRSRRGHLRILFSYKTKLPRNFLRHDGQNLSGHCMKSTDYQQPAADAATAQIAEQDDCPISRS